MLRARRARSGTSAATGWRCSCRWPGPSARRSRGRSLARRSAGASASGWSGVLAGRASRHRWPIYALDFWEHAPGVACIVGAVALLRGRRRWRARRRRAALGAGALLGAGGHACAPRRSSTRSSPSGAACLALLVRAAAAGGRRPPRRARGRRPSPSPWLANLRPGGVARRAPSRGDRASGAAAGGLGSSSGIAVDEAVVDAARAPTRRRRRRRCSWAALCRARRRRARRARSTRRGPSGTVVRPRGRVRGSTCAPSLDGLGFVPGLCLRRAGRGLGALVVAPTRSGARYAVGGRRGRAPAGRGPSSSSGARDPQWGGRYALELVPRRSWRWAVAALEHGAAATVRSGRRWPSAVLVTLTGVAVAAGRDRTRSPIWFVTLVGPTRGRRDRPERLLRPRGRSGVLAAPVVDRGREDD